MASPGLAGHSPAAGRRAGDTAAFGPVRAARTGPYAAGNGRTSCNRRPAASPVRNRLGGQRSRYHGFSRWEVGGRPVLSRRLVTVLPSPVG
jgi:hypothetical protein